MSTWADREFRLEVFKLLKKDKAIPIMGLPPKIENIHEWKVTQTFHRIDTTLIDAVRPLGVSSDDLKRLSVSNFVESYELRIGFVRQTFEIGRGVLAFWVPSLLLGALLIVAWTRRSILETSEALTLFIGTGLASLPFIGGAVQLLHTHTMKLLLNA